MKITDFKHVVWDWNGTLLDDIHACLSAINIMLRKRRLPVLDAAGYRNVFGFPVYDCYVTIGFDFSKEDWNAVSREYHDEYEKTSARSPLRAGTVKTLEALSAASVPMSILSASEQSILDRMVGERGARKYFRRIFGLSNLHGGSKLELGRSLLSEDKTSPDKTIFIGDTTHDYEVASELGCSCVLLTGGHQSEARLRKCPCPVISSLQDLE